jgi:hypothetical protein
MKLLSIVNIILFALLCEFGIDSAPTPSEEFPNRMILMEPDLYMLYWKYDTSDITFEIHVKNSAGWAGFGLSPNGGMHHSDVIVVWVNPNGASSFSDRHIENDTRVLIDKKQDWRELSTSIRDGYLVSKFTRKIKICDKDGEDMDIPNGTPFVIFAYGQVVNGDIAYHRDSRGTRSVPLISSLNEKIQLDMRQIQTVDFRVNVIICELFSYSKGLHYKRNHDF